MQCCVKLSTPIIFSKITFVSNIHQISKVINTLITTSEATQVFRPVTEVKCWSKLSVSYTLSLPWKIAGKQQRQWSILHKTKTWIQHVTLSADFGVTGGPDPDWDLLNSVWASTDTRGLNLYPLTSCHVQNHLQAPRGRSGPLLDRSNTRTETFASKEQGHQCTQVIKWHLPSQSSFSYLEILSVLIKIYFWFQKYAECCLRKQTITASNSWFFLFTLSQHFFVQTALREELQHK